MQLQYWDAIKKDGHQSSSSSSYMDDDVDDDASSPLKSKPPSSDPLYQFSDLIAQLPIKRGLSKYYNGKSQTFVSLTNLKSNEDLEKKEMRSYARRRMKSCKSYRGNLNEQHKIGPKANITKISPKKLYSPSFGAKNALVVNSYESSFLSFGSQVNI